jgi:hypothetical protein
VQPLTCARRRSGTEVLEAHEASWVEIKRASG